MKVIFAGDREISERVLGYLLEQGVEPLALLVPAAGKASHADRLAALCPHLGPERILRGTAFRQSEGLSLLRQLGPDYIVSIHFPYVMPEEVLAIPRVGVLNLHPAFLPYNRGWHTPSWAILDQTPIGATLHFMDAGVDTGDIVHQARLDVSPGDTAHSLYARLGQLEMDVFAAAWPQLASGVFPRTPQNRSEGTFHTRQDLFDDAVQRIELDERTRAGDLIRKLRALTTNQRAEAAYFEEAGRRFRIQVTIHEEQT